MSLVIHIYILIILLKHIYTNMCIYTYIYMYMYIYICIYIMGMEGNNKGREIVASILAQEGRTRPRLKNCTHHQNAKLAKTCSGRGWPTNEPEYQNIKTNIYKYIHTHTHIYTHTHTHTHTHTYLTIQHPCTCL